MPLKSLPDLNLHTQLEALTSKLEAMQAEMDSLQSQYTLASPAPTVISLDQLSQLSALSKESQISTPETFSGKEVLEQISGQGATSLLALARVYIWRYAPPFLCRYNNTYPAHNFSV